MNVYKVERMDNLPGKKYTMCTPKMVSNLHPGSVKVDLEDLHGHMVLLFGSSKCPLMKRLLGDHGHSFQEVASGFVTSSTSHSQS